MNRIPAAMLADADATRRSLLEAAYEEIHRFGFQAASLNAILERTGVTKGALYHHFSSKLQLGYAVLDEHIAEELQRLWFEPLRQPGHPIDVLMGTIMKMGEHYQCEEITLGCPLNNLAQEMSAIDDGFRQRIDSIYKRWQESIETLLTRGQQEGSVSTAIDPADTAFFILASLEGCMSMAKNAQSHDELMRCGKALSIYLNSLRT
ncbi:MAG: TetR/AcrR family transcriptional regulator [Candidatus Thiodiazotropha sp. (ex Lucina aurantia)]|nr:TetR/AcrR family transcriptional regulator [Candidatus Thiodiazotropha taylori]MBT3039921.1 TetR/AcrR family transcriptional regulator [Candidatus Thiodiazotropha sp. (ex Codakia orbicularis)]MBV2104128.1 TetR/AcrR family transcriptional regulator [Candidatus Thiodiazotropha sp. (ex Lucina aurantia)]MBV2099079.1 TetR/AcrR family transcriptional regulator [Candidatus Thiodiazotropha sp. (ex Codakia orbicularis)]MBV2118632.1 TetR/AcrR family transcriptional regulator [Candidatus Thiodiazotroph